MPDRPIPGRSLATRRVVVDIVRAAVVTSYGVIGVDASPIERLLGRLGVGEPGIRVRLDRGIEVDLHLTVAHGLPIAEVARQVDSAVRYALRRSLGHEVHRLTVHVSGLRYQPASVPPPRETPREGAAEAVAPIAPAGGEAGGEPEGAVTGAGRPSGDADAVGSPEAGEAHDGRDGHVSSSAVGAGDGSGRNGRGSARSRRRRAPAGGPDQA